MKGLRNKVVILTGSEGLIGSAISDRLSEEKVQLVGVDIINKHNTLVDGKVKVDLTKHDEIDSLISLVMDNFGRIDGLVNNAYPRTKDWGLAWEEMEISMWERNVQMQLNDTIYLIQQVSKIMQAQKNGSIVNIASIYGVVGNDFSVYKGTGMTSPPAYSAIKGGIINFSRYLASYLGLYKIRVNCVSPGGIFDHQNKIFVSNYINKVPLKRMGHPDDIAPAVSFLLSDDSSYITGQNIIVDGGWTAI